MCSSGWICERAGAAPGGASAGANSEPMALDTAYFDPERFSELAEHLESGDALYETVGRYHALPVRGQGFSEAAVASPRQAGLR